MAKTLYIQLTTVLVALVMTLVVPRVKNLRTMLGHSRSDWTPRNIETCRPMHADVLTGCEDMHLHSDGTDRILFLACAASMQDRLDWFPALGHVSKPRSGIKDKFFAWDLVTDELTQLSLDSWDSDYISHGIDVVPSRSANEVAIYAINHLPSGSVIEKFTHKIGSGKADHVKTFNDQAIVTTPNDIYVADEADDFFYTTNDHKYKTGLLREMETMLQFPTTHLSVHSNKHGGYRVAQSGLQNVNGLAGDRNGNFFMNHVNGYVSVLQHTDDGNVTLVQKIKLGHASDNPSFSADTNELILSGFPRAGEIASFSKHPHEATTASILTRIRVEDLSAKFFGSGSSSAVVPPPLDEFYLDPGTGTTNMTTTAVVDKQGDAWYMTSILSFAVVKCTGYSATY